MTMAESVRAYMRWRERERERGDYQMQKKGIEEVILLEKKKKNYLDLNYFKIKYI